MEMPLKPIKVIDASAWPI